MAKAPKTTAPQEPAEDTVNAPADVVPAPLAAAVEEQDTVFQAHLIRQANHHADLAPSIAKRARDDLEREELLREHEIIAERNRKEREEQQKAQTEREERENAHSLIGSLTSEIEAIEASLVLKKGEIDRLTKLVKG